MPDDRAVETEATEREKETTAQAYLNEYLKQKGEERIHVVHRLDLHRPQQREVQHADQRRERSPARDRPDPQRAGRAPRLAH
mgnify:CR=1 FL=1